MISLPSAVTSLPAVENIIVPYTCRRDNNNNNNEIIIIIIIIKNPQSLCYLSNMGSTRLEKGE